MKKFAIIAVVLGLLAESAVVATIPAYYIDNVLALIAAVAEQAEPGLGTPCPGGLLTQDKTSSKALASRKSAVSKPSVNQP